MGLCSVFLPEKTAAINAAKETEEAEHADGQCERKRKKRGKSGRVALSGAALGNMEGGRSYTIVSGTPGNSDT